jgi:hypothetical protein
MDHQTGTPAEYIFDKEYMDYCDDALDAFCAIYWPCAFKNKRGEQCVNVRERHAKGHQNRKGSVIGSGIYQASFKAEDFCVEWFDQLKNHLKSYQVKLSQLSLEDERAMASKLHLGKMNHFYRRGGGASKYLSQSTCFCCLRDLAKHPLPCGHVLCTSCVKDYGDPYPKFTDSYRLGACPLHDHDSNFQAATEIYFKPPLAGLRILSLDG